MMDSSEKDLGRKGNYFLMPDSIFMLGLKANELAVYAYLRKCVNNKTYQCWPSFATIAKATGVSKSTVKRCVDSLTEKGCIRTERTHRQAKDGALLNGSLMYTLNSPQEMLDRFYIQQIIGGLELVIEIVPGLIDGENVLLHLLVIGHLILQMALCMTVVGLQNGHLPHLSDDDHADHIGSQEKDKAQKNACPDAFEPEAVKIDTPDENGGQELAERDHSQPDDIFFLSEDRQMLPEQATAEVHSDDAPDGAVETGIGIEGIGMGCETDRIDAGQFSEGDHQNREHQPDGQLCHHQTGVCQQRAQLLIRRCVAQQNEHTDQKIRVGQSHRRRFPHAEVIKPDQLDGKRRRGGVEVLVSDGHSHCDKCVGKIGVYTDNDAGNQILQHEIHQLLIRRCGTQHCCICAR